MKQMIEAIGAYYAESKPYYENLSKIEIRFRSPDFAAIFSKMISHAEVDEHNDAHAVIYLHPNAVETFMLWLKSPAFTRMDRIGDFVRWRERFYRAKSQ